MLLGPAVHGVLLHPSLLLGGHLGQLAGVVSTSFLAPYSLTIHLSAPKTSSKTIFDWLDEWGAIHWQEDISIAGRRSRSNLSDLLLFGRTSFYWLTKGGLWFTGRKETNIIDIDIICGCTKEELTKCFVISGALGVGAAIAVTTAINMKIWMEGGPPPTTVDTLVTGMHSIACGDVFPINYGP